MNISIFTCLTSFLIALVTISCLNLWMKMYICEGKYLPGGLLFILLLPIVRLLVPLEFPFTQEIKSKVIYPVVYNFLKFPVIKVGNHSLSVVNLLCLIWIMGAAVVFGTHLRRYRQITKCFKHFTLLPESSKAGSIVRELLQRNGKSQRIRILQTSSIREPLIYGIHKPTIVLPVKELTDTELTNILAHEIGHYVHGDLILKWVFEGLSAFYWWFPPIYSLKRKIYHVMEIRADHFALGGQEKEKRVEYLATLLMICKDKMNSRELPHSTALFSYGDTLAIKRRFVALSSQQSTLSQSIKTAILILFSCFILLSSFGFVVQPQYTGAPAGNTNAFDITPDEHYVMLLKDGTYALYHINGTKIGEFFEISDELTNLIIINEEAN